MAEQQGPVRKTETPLGAAPSGQGGWNLADIIVDIPKPIDMSSDPWQQAHDQNERSKWSLWRLFGKE